jgi:hypothetical protein
MTMIAFEPMKTAADERNVAAILQSWSIEDIRLRVEQIEVCARMPASQARNPSAGRDR